jgi:Domain of unknown function (DUF4269)
MCKEEWSAHMSILDRSYEAAITAARIKETLASFDWSVAGTFPLGIAVDGSDIDIVCYTTDYSTFSEAVWTAYSDYEGFVMTYWLWPKDFTTAEFAYRGWRFELFASQVPLCRQAGKRHFDVEQRLLEMGGKALRQRVVEARESGMKTEPAFASVLRLTGDPYSAMLSLSEASDEALRSMLREQDIAIESIQS